MSRPPIKALIDELRQAGIELWSEGDELRFSAKTPLSSETLERLRSRRSELLAACHEQAAAPSLIAIDRSKATPLSSLQRTFWQLEENFPGSSLSNVFSAFQIEGLLEHAKLVRAFNLLFRRHEAFRTVFTTETGEARQLVQPSLPAWMLPTVDASSLGEAEQALAVAEHVINMVHRPVDAHHAPLLAARLLVLSPERHVLILTVNHLICDEWSFKIAISELVQLYDQPDRDMEPHLTRQYVDYASWERKAVESGAFRSELEYWRNALDWPALPPFELPLDRPRSKTVELLTQRKELRTGSRILDGVQRVANEEDSTLFIAVASALALSLRDWTGLNDVRFAVLVSNRPHPELMGAVGPLFNTVVLRIRFEGTETPREALRVARQVAMEAYANQTLPFGDLLEELETDHEFDRAGLARVLLLFGAASPSTLEADGLHVHELDVGRALLEVELDRPIETVTTFDLLVNLSAKATGLGGALVYKSELFEEDTMVLFADRLVSSLRRLDESPDSSN